MDKAAIYIHGKGGNADEAEHYRSLLSGYDVIGFDYASKTPWEARNEFTEFFDNLCCKYSSVILIANSIGAFFTVHALYDRPVEKALFISPIVDMERLIMDMMMWAGVSEEELCKRGEIDTSFGERLSWEYLSYVRKNPVEWRIDTSILYGEKDTLTSLDTVKGFAERTGADLTVMEGGEHWFHTAEQMAVLGNWVSEVMNRNGDAQ